MVVDLSRVRSGRKSKAILGWRALPLSRGANTADFDLLATIDLS
jgi:hypothetical protein